MRTESQPDRPADRAVPGRRLHRPPLRPARGRLAVGPADLLGHRRARRSTRRYYVPSNMTVAIVGDVKAAEVLPVIEKLLRPAAERAEAGAAAHGRAAADGRAPGRPARTRAAALHRGLPPARRPTHPDDAVYDVHPATCSRAAAPRASTASLVRDKKIAARRGRLQRLPGREVPEPVRRSSACTTPGHTPEEVQAAIRAEIERLKTEDVPDDELQMVKTRAKARPDPRPRQQPGPGRSSSATYQARYGDWRELFREVDQIDKVTKADIRRVANATFVRANRTVGDDRVDASSATAPGEGGEPMRRPRGSAPPLRSRSCCPALGQGAGHATGSEIQKPPLRAFTPQQPKRDRAAERPGDLPAGGPRAAARPRHGADPRRRRATSPPARSASSSIYGQVWRTGGTKARTGDQLDDFLEARARARRDRRRPRLDDASSWDCLKESFDDGVRRLGSSCCATPSSARTRSTLAKNQINTGIARRNDEPAGIAGRESRKLGYGADSPYARQAEYARSRPSRATTCWPGTSATVHPNNMILGVVGRLRLDGDGGELREALGSLAARAAAAPRAETAFQDPKPGVYFVAEGRRHAGQHPHGPPRHRAATTPTTSRSR